MVNTGTSVYWRQQLRGVQVFGVMILLLVAAAAERADQHRRWASASGRVMPEQPAPVAYQRA